MSVELSLYTIESDLANLVEMREQTLASLKQADSEGDLPEIIQRLNEEAVEIDAAIQLYVKTEITKVDNIRAFWKHCELMRDAAKEEARVQSDRSKAWGARLDRLKATCAMVMESIPFPSGKSKKLEGRTGSIYLKANGGKQSVEVTDESLVPDELCTVTVMMSAELWRALAEHVAGCDRTGEFDGEFYRLTPSRKPALSLIGEALHRKCEACDGAPAIGTKDECQWCDGSGHQSVPGCRLSPRSNHVEVR